MRSLVTVGLILLAAGVVGAQPAGPWLFGSTGRGTARWTEEPTGLTYRGGADFGWAVLTASSLRDGFVEARFKPVAGREDQAGGVVWRWRDAGNYYVARANALEDNVTIYHTIAGRRTEKKRASVKVAAGQWHSLRVDFAGGHFTVTFDGSKALEWDDTTFKEAGKVGLWTKADSVTAFDDFHYGGK